MPAPRPSLQFCLPSAAPPSRVPPRAVPLIATHLFAFVVIPATMWVFWTRAKSLKAAGAREPFVALTGLAFLAVAIAGEMGWHVTQEWYYKVQRWGAKGPGPFCNRRPPAGPPASLPFARPAAGRPKTWGGGSLCRPKTWPTPTHNKRTLPNARRSGRS